MNIPHVHQVCIKAWADGKRIERQVRDNNVNDKLIWIPCPRPTWEIWHEYRVEPEKKPKLVDYYQWVLRDKHGRLMLTQNLYRDIEDVRKVLPTFVIIQRSEHTKVTVEE